MKRLLLPTLLLAAASPVQAQLGATTGAGGPQVVDRVVAVVGDTALLLSDVQFELARLNDTGQLPQDPTEREALAMQVFESQVRNLMLVEAAREAGIEVSEVAIEDQVDQQLQQVEQQFGSPMAFDEALRAEGITRAQYRETLSTQARDRQLQQEIMALRLRSRARPTIDESEIQAFFDERAGTLPERPATVSFQQVVIEPRASEEAREAALVEVRQVFEELEAGTDFEVLARRFSDDVGTAEHGGDLGWFRTGRMVPEFERVAFALRPGQTSDIVETMYGYHIIRVDRARGAERQARHILIEPEITDADVARARLSADSVAQAIRDGASLTMLASRYNPSGEQTTLTQYPVDQLIPGYSEALATAQEGEIIGPIELEDPRGNRFAVVRLTDRSDAGAVTIDDVRDQIRQILQEQKMQEQLLEELENEVHVELML